MNEVCRSVDAEGRSDILLFKHAFIKLKESASRCCLWIMGPSVFIFCKISLFVRALYGDLPVSSTNVITPIAQMSTPWP
jgi:hypothetical protein